MRVQEVIARLREECPQLTENIDALASEWLKPVLEQLDAGVLRNMFPKMFNDPIWGTIELLPWEVILLDSPLVQRLRGVRQLGLAHYVYPGAGHDRLEHARGVVQAAERMLDRLRKNADHRRHYGPRRDTAIPDITDEDYYSVRLAALLHDLGHGPFSHAIEPIIEQRYSEEFRRFGNIIRGALEGAGTISVSETVAALLVLSAQMDRVLNHPNFAIRARKEDLALRLVARIVGARSHLDASYLSGVVSGPVDADKLDYMARDGYHAGLSIGLDTNRLISKLEVISITPENVPPAMREVRERAERSPGRRTFDMGISLSGIGAYEQMIVGRVILYDRLYYHHKVRAADAMAQRLVLIAEEERGRPFTIQELFLNVSDDAMVAILGGELGHKEVEGGGKHAGTLAARIRDRKIYHRALAFASRFIAGLEGFQDEKTRDSERAAIWRQVTRGLDSFEDLIKLEQEIYSTAKDIAPTDESLARMAADLEPQHIIVDLPSNKAQSGGNLLLTRTESDDVGIPNLFFDPERWSNAYDQQKRCGYVFCPREYIPLVSLSAKIVIFRRFRFGVNESADRFTKTAGLLERQTVDRLASLAKIDAECYAQLNKRRCFSREY